MTPRFCWLRFGHPFECSVAGVLFCLLPLLSARGGDKPEVKARELPKPIRGSTLDLGSLGKVFKVVDTKYFPAGEFSVSEPKRTVEEDTIVWTLEALDDIKGTEIHKLFHSPRRKVSFTKDVDGKKIDAGAKPGGYSLICDLRWMRNDGPALAKRERLEVWTHLGKEGIQGLVEKQPTKIAIIDPAPKR